MIKTGQWQRPKNGLPFPVFSITGSSLMPRPHPAHMRIGGLVSQVQILGLATEAWSNHWNYRVAFIGIMRKWEVLQWYHSKRCYEMHYSHWPICNLTLTIEEVHVASPFWEPMNRENVRWGLPLRGMEHAFSFNAIVYRELVMTLNIPVHERNGTCRIVASTGSLMR